MSGSWALERAADHAGNFLFNREKQVEWLAGMFPDRKPIIVAPYDAELYGHWWFEGPDWINFLIRKTVCDQKTVRLITPSEYLQENPQCQVAAPSPSSWGYRGYAEVWLNGTNDWIYRHLHKAADRMVELAQVVSPCRRSPAQGAEPGGAGTAPCPELGLGLYHEDRQPCGICGQENEGTFAQVRQAVPRH